jgi:hypothetical protein
MLPMPYPDEAESEFFERFAADAAVQALFPEKAKVLAVARGQLLKAKARDDHPESIRAATSPNHMDIEAHVEFIDWR